MFSPLYLKIFEKSPFLMKTPTQNFAHHTEVKKHPFGVKTPILATLTAPPSVREPLSSSLFVVVPHQVTQTSCWLVKKCVARYLQKRKTIFRTSILGCKYTENVSADGGIFWKNGGNHEFYVFLKLVHHNFPSFPIFCQIDKTC